MHEHVYCQLSTNDGSPDYRDSYRCGYVYTLCINMCISMCARRGPSALPGLSPSSLTTSSRNIHIMPCAAFAKQPAQNRSLLAPRTSRLAAYCAAMYGQLSRVSRKVCCECSMATQDFQDHSLSRLGTSLSLLAAIAASSMMRRPTWHAMWRSLSHAYIYGREYGCVFVYDICMKMLMDIHMGMCVGIAKIYPQIYVQTYICT